MRIPRSPLLPAVLLLLAPAARPAEPKPEVVKAVRAMLDTKKEEERDALKAALLKRPDLDWASLKAGLEAGPYFQKPLETAFGERGSKGTFDIVFTGADGKPRGFSLWVPKKYEAKPLPVLVYLHHDPGQDQVAAGSNKASTALGRFHEVSEDRGILVVAPYTAKGAEWWTPEGQRLVAWTLKQVRQRYNVDDDRIALCGALDGADSVWCLGQTMPGTWSSLMPMTGDPYEISAVIRPLFLATLDRMDILMGVPGRTQGSLGDKDIGRFLSDLGPMFGQRMRITTTIWPQAQTDFSYLEQVAAQIGSFTADRKRKAYADEVDVETDSETELRSLWLENHGYDPNGTTAPGHFEFRTTLLKWTPPPPEPPSKKIGVQLDTREGAPGIVIRSNDLLLLYPGDVILEADGVPLSKVEDLKAAIDKHDWNDEVRLLVARDVKESDVPNFERTEQRYKRYRGKIAELKAAGKPIPKTLWDETAEEGAGGEEGAKEEDDSAGIITSEDGPKEDDDKGAGGGHGKVKKIVKITERWVKVRRLGGLLVRQDFGATWDASYDRTEGVRVASVVAGSLAARSGFKEGDLIVQVGAKGVKNIHDIEDAIRTIDAGDTPFKFEEEPEGGNAIEFTIRRPNADGTYQPDTTLTVRWVKVKSSRVDARWDKKENTLYVLANNVSSFTLYFTDDLVEPGKEFNLFINGVPIQDLEDPKAAPEYPKDHDDDDAAAGDRVFRMLRKRAKTAGWTPDLPWALDQFLATWDRRQVYGAKRTFDLTKMTAAFEQAQKRAKREDDSPARLKKAYEEYRGRGKG